MGFIIIVEMTPNVMGVRHTILAIPNAAKKIIVAQLWMVASLSKDRLNLGAMWKAGTRNEQL